MRIRVGELGQADDLDPLGAPPPRPRFLHLPRTSSPNITFSHHGAPRETACSPGRPCRGPGRARRWPRRRAASRPVLGSSRPAMIRPCVDLPQPEGPITQTSSRRCTSNEMRSQRRDRAVLALKRARQALHRQHDRTLVDLLEARRGRGAGSSLAVRAGRNGCVDRRLAVDHGVSPAGDDERAPGSSARSTGPPTGGRPPRAHGKRLRPSRASDQVGAEADEADHHDRRRTRCRSCGSAPAG